MLVNALRGHLAEFGLVEAQGLHKVARLIAIVMDEMDGRVPHIARQVLKVIVSQIEDIQTRIAGLETQVPRVAQEQPSQPTSGHHPGDRADHRHCGRCDGCRSEHIPQWQRVCRLARASAETELYRRQSAPRRN